MAFSIVFPIIHVHIHDHAGSAMTCDSLSIPCRIDRDQCILTMQVCDGVEDCADGTDEYFCGCKFCMVWSSSKATPIK